MDHGRLNIQQRKILGKSLVLSLCGIKLCAKRAASQATPDFYMNLLY